jgi:hypothetical protein
MKRSFEAKLEAKGPGGAWTFILIPFDVAEAFGSKARIAVAGAINGFEFHTSLMPEGDGSHSMMVGKELQAGANARAGDVVTVTLWRDDQQRVIATPADLEQALRANRLAAELFETMTYSQRKEYIDWINHAKQALTRTNRIAKAVDMLAAGKKRTR